MFCHVSPKCSPGLPKVRLWSPQGTGFVSHKYEVSLEGTSHRLPKVRLVEFHHLQRLQNFPGELPIGLLGGWIRRERLPVQAVVFINSP